MINNNDKIKLITERLNNIQGDIDSYVFHADIFQNKYSLEDVLPECNAIKLALLQELEFLGGTWNPLTNQG
jgi:hypothetical protein